VKILAALSFLLVAFVLQPWPGIFNKTPAQIPCNTDKAMPACRI